MAKQQQYINIACPECGGDLQFREGKRKLGCTNCKYTRALSNRYGTQVQKKGLKDRVNLSRFERGLDDRTQGYQCQKCKAQLVIKNDQKLSRCPFCKSPELKNADLKKKVFQPYELIPPTIPKKLARAKFKKFLRSGFFTFLPPNLSSAAADEAIQGVYLPAFLFDTYSRTTWKGEIGIKVPGGGGGGGGGNRGGGKGGGKGGGRGGGRGGGNKGGGGGKTPDVIWDFTEGYFEHLHDNILVMASKAGDRGLIEAIPFDPSEMVKFDQYYLGDWSAELYQQDEIKALEIAEKIIDGDLRRQAEYKIRGRKKHQYRKLETVSEKNCLTFRYVWVPMWMTSYTYQGKTFQYMINAQTGRLSGKRPLSIPRVIIFVIGVILFLLLLVLLVSIL